MGFTLTPQGDRMTPTDLLPSRLRRRIEAAGPIRVGLIGAGKFGSMFLAQVPTSPHIDVVAIADLDPERAKTACRNVGWNEERVSRTRFVEDGIAMIAEPGIEVVIEATGNPLAGVRHALAASGEGKHIVMVNVEADVLAGPWLAAKPAAPAPSIRWPMATSRRSCARWSTGRDLAAFRWSPPARARATSPHITA
jgi:predicted homoserine dehydrogenase-like protein